jgi:hypothetical protein
MHMTRHHKNYLQWHLGHDHAGKVRIIAQNKLDFGFILDSTDMYTVIATAGVVQPDFGIAATTAVNHDASNNNGTRKSC